MRILNAFLTAGCLAGSLSAVADGMPPVPDDYPSHTAVGSCNQQALSERLQRYNETRLALAGVLRHLAEEPHTAQPAKARLLGYADNLDAMRQRLPAPDPDSDAFRNFDFQLGITLTSMTLFLNTEDAHLTRRFVRDRDDPGSELGVYLARLDESRRQYMDHLAQSHAGDCHG